MVIASNSKLFMYRNYDSLDMIIDQRVFSMAVAKHLVVVSYDSKISTYKYMHGRWALVETIETDRTFTSLALHDTELLLGEPNSRTVFYMSEYYFTDIPTASPTISPTASPQAPTTGMPTVSPTSSPTAQVIVLSDNIVYSFIAALILLVLGCAFIFVWKYHRKPIIEDVAAPHI